MVKQEENRSVDYNHRIFKKGLFDFKAFYNKHPEGEVKVNFEHPKYYIEQKNPSVLKFVQIYRNLESDKLGLLSFRMEVLEIMGYEYEVESNINLTYSDRKFGMEQYILPLNSYNACMYHYEHVFLEFKRGDYEQILNDAIKVYAANSDFKFKLIKLTY